MKAVFIFIQLFLAVASISVNYRLSYIRLLMQHVYTAEIVAQPFSDSYAIQYEQLPSNWYQQTRFLYIPVEYGRRPNGFIYSINVIISDLKKNSVELTVDIVVENQKMRFRERDLTTQQSKNPPLYRRVTDGSPQKQIVQLRSQLYEIPDLSILDHPTQPPSKIQSPNSQQQKAMIAQQQRQQHAEKQLKQKVHTILQKQEPRNYKGFPNQTQMTAMIERNDIFLISKTVQAVAVSELLKCEEKIAYLLEFVAKIDIKIQELKIEREKIKIRREASEAQIQRLKKEYESISAELSESQGIDLQQKLMKNMVILEEYYSAYNSLYTKHKNLEQQLTTINKKIEKSTKQLTIAKIEHSRARNLFTQMSQFIEIDDPKIKQLIEKIHEKQSKIQKIEEQIIGNREREKMLQSNKQSNENYMRSVESRYRMQEVEVGRILNDISLKEESMKKMRSRLIQIGEDIRKEEQSIENGQILDIDSKINSLEKNEPNFEQELDRIYFNCYQVQGIPVYHRKERKEENQQSSQSVVVVENQRSYKLTVGDFNKYISIAYKVNNTVAVTEGESQTVQIQLSSILDPKWKEVYSTTTTTIPKIEVEQEKSEKNPPLFQPPVEIDPSLSQQRKQNEQTPQVEQQSSESIKNSSKENNQQKISSEKSRIKKEQNFSCLNFESQSSKSYAGRILFIRENIILAVTTTNQLFYLKMGPCTRIEAVGSSVPYIGQRIYWKGSHIDGEKGFDIYSASSFS